MHKTLYNISRGWEGASAPLTHACGRPCNWTQLTQVTHWLYK